MIDVLEGRGRLEGWDNPNGNIEVAYKFQISTSILARSGFPRVATRRHAEGVVHGMRNELIQPGYYRLFSSDGEVVKVQNLGGEWTILGS